MITLFDTLPVDFADSTIDRLRSAHIEMQNEGVPDLKLAYSNTFRADVIESLLYHIIESPNDDNSSVIANLAVYAVEWLESELNKAVV